MTATRTRTPRLTPLQKAALDQLVRMSTGVYYSYGGWVPGPCVGRRGAVRQLVAKGLVDTTVAKGIGGLTRPVYRPRAVA